MKARSRIDPWLFLLLALGSFLLLTHLNNGRLWQDEAETAVLGRNILSFGYPKAFDGINHLNPRLPVQKGYAWTYHSWLPMYLAAGSFALLGVNTFAARLPFALLGIGAIALTYQLAIAWSEDRRIARLTTVLLVTSVPFLLHMRQCRYYAPAVFGTLWVTWSYWKFLRGTPRSWLRLSEAAPFPSASSWLQRSWLGLAAGLLFLFHADHGVFLPVFLALVFHFVWSRPEPKRLREGIGLVIAVLLLAVPWLIFLKSWQHHRPWSLLEIWHHAEFYVRQINRYLFPLWFWLLLLCLRRRWFHHLFGENGASSQKAWALVGCLLGAGFLFLVLIPEQRHFRYLIFLIPFLYFIQAVLVQRLIDRRWLLGGLAATALILTDFFHYSAPSVLMMRSRIRSLPLEFLQELQKPYRGPIDGIVEYLAIHGKPGERVKTPYEEHPIIFYTPLTMELSRPYEGFNDPSFPEWIVLRRHWLPWGFFEGPYFKEIRQRYQEIVLDAPDIPWQNRPDPGYHRFLTDRAAPPVVIYRRRR